MKFLTQLLLFLCVVNAWAADTISTESRSSSGRITVQGRKEITVTTETVRLGDIADITSSAQDDYETIIGLKRIQIASSPKPGQDTSISATQVLERMEEEGVNLKRVGYVFPRTVSIKRASRTLTIQEVENAIKSYLKSEGRDISLKQIRYKGDAVISPGIADIKVSPFPTRNQGEMGFDLNISVNGIEEVKFPVTTGAEEWKEVPIASRTVGRGKIVESTDIRMARLNVNALPPDVATNEKDIVGMEVGNEIPQGDFFKQTRLEIPPIVQVGQNVMLRYRFKTLEATATGVALDAGIKNQDIRVRNSASKKIINGTVIEPGLVEVKAQNSSVVLKQVRDW